MRWAHSYLLLLAACVVVGTNAAIDDEDLGAESSASKHQLPQAAVTVSKQSWDAAHNLVNQKMKPMIQENTREISEVMGTFVVKLKPIHEEELGEGGPLLLPQGRVIRKAERMVAKISDAKQRTLAEAIIKDKAKNRNQLVSATVKQMSQKLRKAKQAEGYMAGVDLGLAKLLQDPHIGNQTNLNTAAGHKLQLTVEGMRYHDGRLFYAPQGKHSTVQGCKSFLAAHKHKDIIAQAQLKAMRARSALASAKVKANELRSKIASGSNKQTSGGEVPAATAKRLQQQRELDQLRLKMAKLMKARRLTEAVVMRQKAAAIEAAGTRVKAADVKARELELEGREKRLFERETELKSATVRLQATAQALRTARDSTLIMNFPKRQEELKLQKEQLDLREKRLRKHESSLRLRNKILKAKVDAFNKGVEKSIRSSIHGASMTADRSYNHARVHIADEVDRFTAHLQQLNRKYSNGYGSKVRRKINTSVKSAMTNMKKIKHGMNAAARAAGAKKKPCTIGHCH